MVEVRSAMMPDHSLSSQTLYDRYLTPDGGDRPYLTIDWEKGGIAIADPSEGLRYQDWVLTYENNQFFVEGLTTQVKTPGPLLYGIEECNLAFDQNMNVFIAYVLMGQAWYFWYDPIAAAYKHQIMSADTVNPRCCMDDKRLQMVDTSDIILAYTRGEALYYREQRDRYTIEYLLKTSKEGFLEAVGMNASYRLQFMLVSAFPPIPPLPPLSQAELDHNALEQAS